MTLLWQQKQMRSPLNFLIKLLIVTLTECRRILDEHPEWIGNQTLDRIFLVHVPEASYSIDNEKMKYLSLLIEDTLNRLSLSETPSIYFHYSAKFSREDRKVILEAARRIKPQGKYSFI
jgi:hypothetical protein